MDYLTEKEIKSFKGEVKASQVAVEAEKYTFCKKLMEDIGPKMMDFLDGKSEPEEKKIGLFERIFGKGKKKGNR